MIVRQENFRDILRKLASPSIYALDTETTGLFPYKGDRLFSLIIADKSESYYFNFQSYPDLNPSWVLPRAWLQEFASIFLHPNNLWFIHNSKFDLGFLLQEGLEIGGEIHDTEIVARQLESCHLTYGLGDCAKRIGLAKSSAVDDYIDTHKLYTWETPPGKKSRKKNKHFNLVPFHIISAYGEQDGRVTHQLGMWQRARLEQLSIETPAAYRSPKEIYENDKELVKVCFDMEKVGVRVNLEYARGAVAYYENVIADKAKEFFDISGLVLDDTKSVLVEAFTRAGEAFPRTEKGNPSFTDDVLAGFKTPLASVVRAYREASKITAAYFRSFIFFADQFERIHANFRIAGTETGRFSVADPPLQQLPKEETGPFPVRRAIVPFDEESCLVMIDYSQMEYRMMVDYARDHKLAAMIRAGLDVHEATSKMVGISRNYAKCVDPNTWVFDGVSYKRIGQINKGRDTDSFYLPESIKQVMTPGGLVNVNSFYSNGDDERILVCARRGLLACSKNHKFKLADGSLVKACYLKEGDTLQEEIKCSYDTGTLQHIPINPFLHSSEITSSNYFATINEDLAYVLGMFMGDGCANISHVNIATGAHAEFGFWQQSVFESLTKAGFIAKIIPNVKNSTGGFAGKIYFGSRHTVRVLMQLGALNSDGKKVFSIPDYIFESPKEVRLSYLAGLIDTDGSISKRGDCSFTTKSWQLAQDTVCLAHSLDIHVSIEPNFNQTYQRYYFRIRFAKRCNPIFRDYLRHSAKVARLGDVAFKYTNNAFPNAVIKILPLEPGPLVDINIDSDEHIYLTNGLTTHNTLNFMLLYGGGIDKLAGMLKITRAEATKLKDRYFSSLPTVRAFSRKVIRTATEAGRIYNWAGYVTHYKDPNFSYTAPNHLIQGGCAQVVRRAMTAVWRLLQGRRSRLILQIHDELLFNMYPEDFHLIPKIKEIMENSYVPDTLVPLTCEVSHSFVSWADKQPGIPEINEIGSQRNRP